MTAGTYPLVVELSAGSRTRLDYVRLKQGGTTGIDGTALRSSWGRIKGLYR